MKKSLTIPPTIATSEIGSFARSTIEVRKPQILAQILTDNEYTPAVRRSLEDFRDELAGKPARPLQEAAPDAAEWNAELGRIPGRTWLELPWFFAETYFYRRVLEITGWFQPGSGFHLDPFGLQKTRSLPDDVAWFGEMANQWSGLDPEAASEVLLHSCLWGNRADLSNLNMHAEAAGGLSAFDERHLLLIDHTRQVQDRLSKGVRRVDFLTDNVGRELLFDLALADFLLQECWTEQVTLRVKDHPYFVSDVMPVDVQVTIAALISAGGQAGVIGSRLASFLAAGRLEVREHPFWTSFHMFPELPEDLCFELGQADLVVVKGDANYRRLVSDAHWPFTTPMDAVCAYFPADFVSLRTIKSEVMVGLQPGEAEALFASDPGWLLNGKRGIIYFIQPGD